jgi:hypothetical protein
MQDTRLMMELYSSVSSKFRVWAEEDPSVTLDILEITSFVFVFMFCVLSFDLDQSGVGMFQ